MKYHMGSFALGSFVIMFIRVPRMLLRCLTAIAYPSGGNQPNALSKCVWCACACCLNSFEWGIKVLSKDAWMDVAINGNPFFQAAFHSLLILEHDSTTAIA